jgi:hypothetical protein
MEASMAKKPASPAVEILLGEAEPDTLRTIGGSKSDRFNNALIAAMVSTGWFPSGQSSEDRDRQLFVSVTGMQAFKPADEIEGMIAAQAMAMHHASMECSRRAMLHEQAFEVAQGLRKAAANASRNFVELLSALDRKRGKGQVVRVERVVVNEGGQAIVGNVQGSTPAAADARAAPPLAIGHEAPGITMDDLVGARRELVATEEGGGV